MEEYRYLATSREGFIQQVATSYVRHGYYFYVQGRVPEGKDPAKLDRKLLKRYGIAKNKKQRWRRKKQGLANLQYIRFERDWLMMATKGEHDWFVEERDNIRDCRRQPILVLGYSVSSVQGGYLSNSAKVDPNGPPVRDTKRRVRVQISRAEHDSLRTGLLSSVRSRRQQWFIDRLRGVDYEPYAPVRSQLVELLRQVNKQRLGVGRRPVPIDSLRLRRRPVQPFNRHDP